MSKEERVEGARQIEDRIRGAFAERGKEVNEIEWRSTSGGGPLDAESLNVRITVGGQVFNINSVPREAIEDYPGGVGNEKLDAVILNLARQ